MGLVARELGLGFTAYDPLALMDDGRRPGLLARLRGAESPGIPARFSHLRALVGRCRASNVMHGNYRGRPVTAFDCDRRDVGDSGGERTRFASLAVITCGGSFPQLVIRPRNNLDAVAAAVGLGNLSFESGRFAERFSVTCSDRRLASAVISVPMMEFLLTHQGWYIEINGGDACIWNERWWDPGEFSVAVRALSSFLDLVPRFVWKDVGAEEEVARQGTAGPACS